ncbi:FkbM family methyltransferase [Pseudofrankia inefficax]|uniref:Methyltransferase FkbM family n=1 Tax=Pseudofrankia inefficax (strain DSM 45817 / CECT 9037 / DDB 130130 / EuI1c) TaxID=298654 RepID=E3IYZ7_PSEI1|nr:FkbM family methyltransferase [Pseudofrankia inefficax]ADP80280.1 methyltransferase FkbM family [Pseudofrankia inefficax]
MDLLSTLARSGAGQGPIRWRLADRLAANLPDVRGHDRVVGWARGSNDEYVGPLRGRFANGMHFDLDSCRDGSARALSELRYRPPALAPVFAAVLGPGDCCYDVGANIGVYALWAAGLVGTSGQVHAFEPVPDTMAVLSAMVRRNGLSQVRLESCAVGATVGEIGMRVYRDASGLAHPVATGSADHVATLTTLDAYVERHRAPDLVKIDVEGFEIDVLRGATNLLSTRSPALLLEMLPAHLTRQGRSQAELVATLAELGYMIFNLTPQGLAMQGLFTSNVLAITPRWERFDRVVAALERTPFPRNQTT